jgi:serine/threonine-protein kinase
VISRIGSGGMAHVSLAVATGTEGVTKLVVLKCIREDIASDVDLRTLFLHEARIAMRLNHPNIVHTYEVREVNGAPVIVMEYLEGQSLAALIQKATRPRFPLAVGLRVLCDTLRGLHYAHIMTNYDGSPMPLVHRDVSPQNVLVTYMGHAKVVDFGIAKVASSASQTGIGVIKGKAGYMAPEQVRGGAVDARTDIFAVGVMLWELLAQKRLAPGPMGELSILTRRLQGADPKVHEAAPHAPAAVADICARAMAHDPDARFSSAAEMAAAVEDYLSKQPEGQRGETSEVAALMQTLFATEREKVRRGIEQALRDPSPQEVAETLSTSTLPSPTTSGRGDRWRTFWASLRRGARGRAPWIALAPCALGAALLVIGWRDNVTPRVDQAVRRTGGEAMRAEQAERASSSADEETSMEAAAPSAPSHQLPRVGSPAARAASHPSVVPGTSENTSARHKIDETNPYR